MTTNVGINNHRNVHLKISEIYEKNEKWSLEAKNGLPEFLVEAKLMFWMRTLLCRGQKYEMLSKIVKKCQKHFQNQIQNT